MDRRVTTLVLGAGKIGQMIAQLLSGTGDYSVCVADVDARALGRWPAGSDVETMVLDVTDPQALRQAMVGRQVVISALSYHFNPLVAQAALDTGSDYFDLTEDVATTRAVRAVSQEAGPHQIFVPQCGLAPGFVSIVGHHLVRQFDQVDTVHMRVGALPQFPTGRLKYNLTWSTDGLINEYCNVCEAIYDGRRREVLPLDGLESFSLDGVRYEAFHTSGGLGSLCETLEGQVRELDYKTIRYPGHREFLAFLLQELRLSQNRDMLKQILEHAIPITSQDVVIVFCTVTGRRAGRLVKMSDARKIYSAEMAGEQWSAIQLTTAAGVCTMVDLRREGTLPVRGWVKQEEVPLPQFLANRFGALFAGGPTTQCSRLTESPGLATIEF